jgi:hypothetical protein
MCVRYHRIILFICTRKIINFPCIDSIVLRGEREELERNTHTQKRFLKCQQLKWVSFKAVFYDFNIHL